MITKAIVFFFHDYRAPNPTPAPAPSRPTRPTRPPPPPDCPSPVLRRLPHLHLDDCSVARFLTSAPVPHPYSLLVFFDAAQLRSKPDHHRHRLRSEFALVSSSFTANHASSPASSRSVFFCDLEYEESESSFSLFGVTSLPHVRHVGPLHRSLRNSDRMDQSEFSGPAESVAQLVETGGGREEGEERATSGGTAARRMARKRRTARVGREAWEEMRAVQATVERAEWGRRWWKARRGPSSALPLISPSSSSLPILLRKSQV